MILYREREIGPARGGEGNPFRQKETAKTASRKQRCARGAQARRLFCPCRLMCYSCFIVVLCVTVYLLCVFFCVGLALILLQWPNSEIGIRSCITLESRNQHSYSRSAQLPNSACSLIQDWVFECSIYSPTGVCGKNTPFP